jgi:hypothetical protein
VTDGAASDLVTIASRDGGKTWSAPMVVLGGLASHASAWMDGRPDGSADLVVVANRTQGATLGQLTLLRLDARHAGLVAAQMDLGQAEFMEFLAVDHDGAGRAHLTWTDRGSLYYLREA